MEMRLANLAVAAGLVLFGFAVGWTTAPRPDPAVTTVQTTPTTSYVRPTSPRQCVEWRTEYRWVPEQRAELPVGQTCVRFG